MRESRIGLTSFALRFAIGTPDFSPARPLNPTAVLEKAASLGAEVIQICDNLPLAPFSDRALDDLARRAGELGLELEVGTRGSRPEQLDRYLEVAERLGARVLRVVLSDAEEGRTIAEELATVRNLVPRLAAAGVALALENRFRLTPSQMADFVRAVGAPEVGACLDPLNAISRLVGPEETVRALAPLAVTAHVKDGAVTREGAVWVLRGCPVGEGQVDVEGLVAALCAYGRAPNLLAEGWMEPLADEAATLAREEDWARRGIAYLRGLQDGV
jgi:sugar phosphate isomerase/epimerase